MGMKMVLPKNREESRVQGFESFSSDIMHEEKDKFFPKSDTTVEQLSPNDLILQSDEPSSEDYLNAPENEVEYQRHLNFFPPVINSDEEERRFVENYPPLQQQQPTRAKNAHNFGNQFIHQAQPRQHYSQTNNRQQNRENKANHRNIQNFGHNGAQQQQQAVTNGQAVVATAQGGQTRIKLENGMGAASFYSNHYSGPDHKGML